MFGGKAERPVPRGGALSVIGADTAIKGDVTTTSDLHVDGAIMSAIDCGQLIQGASSRSEGVVTAKTARLAGIIKGRSPSSRSP
ncbi:polymer-forming cytoskeletal protein [uncultured Sphingomonas sp.]|uniref:bactofilin family protein n=1 Tax=uncultured Sphingomonas sp. TaxID=158754 RepID=UPI0035CA2D61